MEMDISERLIIRADGCLKQPFPETAALWPPRLQVSALLHGDAIDLGHSHLNDSRRYRGDHAENQICGARGIVRPRVHASIKISRTSDTARSLSGECSSPSGSRGSKLRWFARCHHSGR